MMLFHGFIVCNSTAGVLGYIYNSQVSSGFTQVAATILTGGNSVVTYARGLNDIVELQFNYLPSSAPEQLSVCDMSGLRDLIF